MRAMFFILLSISQIGCSEEKQYYSRHFHNESNQKIKNLVLDFNDGTTSRLSGGTMIPHSRDVVGANYIRPPDNPVLRWEDMDGNQYEQKLDLRGIFPTDFNGGHFHVTIEEDFSVSYGFVFLKQYEDGEMVRDRIVYSPENRTAK